MERSRAGGVPPGCRWLDLLTIPDERGVLAVAEEHRHVPFRIGSVRWGHDASDVVEDHRDAPGGDPQRSVRGSAQDSAVVALKGTCDLVVGSPGSEATVKLHRPDVALHLPQGAPWSIERWSPDALWLELEAGEGQPREVASRVAEPEVVALPTAPWGAWSVVEAAPGGPVPFPIRRVYYLYGVDPGSERGGHAHRDLDQVLVAVTGGLDVVLHDGHEPTTIRLDRPDAGLAISTGIWRELKNFSPGAVCLALASMPYDEGDYIRDFDEFVRWRARGDV